MSSSRPRGAAPSITGRRPAAPSGARWWLLSIGAIVMVAGVYYLAVRTAEGQRVENAALRGAYQVDGVEVTVADDVLGTFTLASIGIAMAILAVIGWVRGGWRLAGVAVAIVGGAQVVTQVLKRIVLTRPDLIDAPEQWLHNSFPSGHTTAAMSIALATLVVVAWRWRTIAMLIVMAWTVGVGSYTVVARWHRLSDTIGADAIALLAFSVGALVLVRSGWLRRVEADAEAPFRAALVTFGSVVGIGLLALGGFVGWTGMGQEPGDVADFNLYLAAQAIASAGSLLTILLAWASWHRVEAA